MKTSIKGKLVRMGAGFLAGLMFFSAIGSTALTAKAAEPVNTQIESQYEAMTEEELQEYFENYLEQADRNSEDVDGNPAVAILAYLGTKVMDKIVDKALDSAWESVFGKDENTQAMLKKLDEINGKLDQTMRMLNYLMEMIQKQAIKDSITQKNRYFNAIQAEAQTIDARFDASKGKDNYKDLRWTALQKWYSLRLEGTSDAMSSLRFYANTVTDKNHTNWNGSYFSQYLEYANMAFMWDTQRVSFEEAQRDREFYTFAQIATYNLLYLQYAEEKGVQGIDYKSERTEIGKMLKEVMDSYEQSPIERLSPDSVTFTIDGKKVEIYDKFDDTGVNKNLVRDLLVPNQKCWRIEDTITWKLNDRRPSGTHVMTTSELDLLLKAAQKDKKSSIAFMQGAGWHVPEDTSILLSTNKNSSQVWHYGDKSSGRRQVYMEHYIFDGGNTDNHGKHAMTVSVDGNDCFSTITFGRRSSWCPCVYEEGDYWSQFENRLGGPNAAVFYVKNSDAVDTDETTEEYTQMDVNGVITSLDGQQEGGLFTLTTADGKELTVEYNTEDKYTTLDSLLEEGSTVTVEYQINSKANASNTIFATKIVVENKQ